MTKALAQWVYFVSPEYKHREDWSNAKHDGDKYHGQIITPDPEDNFPEALKSWLAANSIDRNLIISQEGTFSRIYHTTLPNPASNKKEGTVDVCPFNRVVCVASAPIGRTLPESLVELLDSKKYLPTTKREYTSIEFIPRY